MMERGLDVILVGIPPFIGLKYLLDYVGIPPFIGLKYLLDYVLCFLGLESA